jgi:membrane-associated phospholipid phosphatase
MPGRQTLNPRGVLHSLRPVDALVLAFTVLLSLINLVLSAWIPAWTNLLIINAAGAIAIIALARSTAAASGRRLTRAVHDWYPVPAIFLLFKEVYVIIQSLGRNDWDDLLIAADRAIFGGDPTVWLSKFSTPLLTEILQIAYASYYFIMLAVGIELYITGERKKFALVVFTIVFGFCLSYLGYLAFPAVGPRFTLHDFRLLESDLPGIFFTGPIRDFLDAGESIPKNIVNAAALAQRDAFPSGHTQMTLISLYFATLYSLRSRTILYVLGALLIISTVYLRYHYVVDLLGGALFMWLTILAAPRLFRWWESRRAPS